MWAKSLYFVWIKNKYFSVTEISKWCLLAKTQMYILGVVKRD